MSVMTLAALQVNGFALGALVGAVLAGAGCAAVCAGARLVDAARR